MKATVVVARGKETIHSMFGTVRLEHDGSASTFRLLVVLLSHRAEDLGVACVPHRMDTHRG